MSRARVKGRTRRNHDRATVLLDRLLDGEADLLLRKAVNMALSGDGPMMRLLLDRLLPPRDERAVPIKIGPTRNAEEICAAMSDILRAVGDGEITPTDGQVLVNMLATQLKVIETAHLERRMQAVEEALAKER